MRLKDDFPRCPKCGSKNTVGRVHGCAVSKNTFTKTGYFCSNCLLEFDEDNIRICSKEGSWLTNIQID